MYAHTLARLKTKDGKKKRRNKYDEDDAKDEFGFSEEEEDEHTVDPRNQEYLDVLNKQIKDDESRGFTCCKCSACCTKLGLNDPKRPYFVKMVHDIEVNSELRSKIIRRRCVQFNVFWVRLTRTMIFDSIILIGILAATTLIGLRTYVRGEGSNLEKTLDTADAAITVLFMTEIVIKMLAKGPHLYFTIYWNIFDFFIVMVDYLPIPLSMTIFRLLRLLRIAKLVKAFPNLQVILVGLQQGLKSIFYNSVLLLLMMWVFAILGMLLFRSNDPFHFGTLHNSLFTLFRVATLEDWTDVMYINIHGCGETNYQYPEKADVNNSNPLTGFGPAAAYEYNTPCDKSSAKGIVAALYFILYVVIAGLVMLSIFIGVVTSAMDDATAKIAEVKRRTAIQKAKDARQKNAELKAKGASLMAQSNGGCKKCVSVCCFSFKACLRTWFDSLSLEEARAEMFEKHPESCYLKAAKKVAKAVESKTVDAIIMFTILVAAICAGLEVSDKNDWKDMLAVAEVVILIIFIIEFLAKLFGTGTRPWDYFRETMNIFDFIIVLVCLLSLVLSGNDASSSTDAVTTSADTGAYSALRLLRLLRLLKLLDGIPQLRIIITGVYRGLSSITFIFLLLMLVFYIYAIIGLALFQDNDPWHFANLHTAMLSLFRASTFEDWTDIYYINYYGCEYWGYDAPLPDPNGRAVTIHCTNSKDQPLPATLYFVSFIFIAAFIMLSLFVGVVTTSMFEAKNDMDIRNAAAELEAKLVSKFPEELNEKQMRYFRKLFESLDIDRSGYLTMQEITATVIHSELKWSKKICEELLDSVDVNDDGVVDFAEFIVMVMAAMRGKSASLLFHEIKITTGRIQLNIEWFPVVPPQIQFVVTIYEARGLKRMDLIGENDTYALVTVAGVTKQTVTISGRRPAWGIKEGHGQELIFHVDKMPDRLDIRLYDEDESSADDQIGSVILDSSARFGDGKEWHQLTDDRNKRTGEVLVKISTSDLPADPNPAGRLRISTIQGQNLKAMDNIGKNDVYAVVTVADSNDSYVPNAVQATADAEEFANGDGSRVRPVGYYQSNPVALKNIDPQVAQRTPTVEEGGAEPVWFGGGCVLTFERKHLPRWLAVRCMDEDEGLMNSDDHIGTAVVDLQNPHGYTDPPTGFERWSTTAWFDLFCETYAALEKGAPENIPDMKEEKEQAGNAEQFVDHIQKQVYKEFEKAKSAASAEDTDLAKAQ
eukprot:SAG31_NODE_275_length_18666_cov_8.489309_12_plen_1217_part_00